MTFSDAPVDTPIILDSSQPIWRDVSAQWLCPDALLCPSCPHTSLEWLCPDCLLSWPIRRGPVGDTGRLNMGLGLVPLKEASPVQSQEVLDVLRETASRVQEDLGSKLPVSERHADMVLTPGCFRWRPPRTRNETHNVVDHGRRTAQLLAKAYSRSHGLSCLVANSVCLTAARRSPSRRLRVPQG